MCNYCCSDERIEYLDKCFIYEDLDCGFFEELTIFNLINTKERVIELAINNASDDVKVFRKEINYCPFCGDRLITAG